MKRIPALATVLLLTLAAAGCGGGDDEAGGTTAASGSTGATTTAPAALTKVEMVQDWPYPWVGWIPWLVADERGYFEDEGIQVEFRKPPTVSDSVKFLSTGRADVGFTTILDVILARAQDAPIISTGAYSQTNNWGLIWRQGDKPNLKALKGKKIGIYQDAWTKAQLALVLRSVGLKLDDVTMVPAPSSTAQLLLAKKVDVTTGITNAEQAEVDVTGKQTSTMLLGRQHGVPNSYVFVLAMNNTFREEKPEVAKAFMRAVTRGIEAARENPDEAVSALLDRYPDAGDRAYIAAAWKATVPLFESVDTQAHGLLWSNEAVWADMTRTLKAEGLIDKEPEVSSLYTNDDLPAS